MFNRRTSVFYFVAVSLVAACSSPAPESSRSEPNAPVAQAQVDDLPREQWLLATDGCGLGAVVRAADERDPVNPSDPGPGPGFADAGSSQDASSWPQSDTDSMSPDASEEVGSPDLPYDAGDTDPGDVDPCDGDVREDVDTSACPDAEETTPDEPPPDEPPPDEDAQDKAPESPGDAPVDSPWVTTQADRLATFSSDVDTASYARTRSLLRSATLPEPANVRVEDFMNAFSYPYPATVLGSERPFWVSVEGAPTPFGPPGSTTLRIGVQGAVAATCDRPRANLVFLIDVSGSMQDPRKLPLVKYAISRLAAALNQGDTVALVTYAGSVAEVLGPTPATETALIQAGLERLTAAGSTAGAAGLDLAYQVARRGFIPGGINRVLMATDGDFNVGLVGDDLVRRVEDERATGITLSALGFGTSGYSDLQLNDLSDHGNGNYTYVDDEAAADRLVQDSLMATLFMIGRDLKLQVELDPAVVRRYRVIGYDTRELTDDQFADDHVDAGDVGAGHAVTALIEVEWVDGVAAAETAIGVVGVRYKPAFEQETSVLVEHKISGRHLRPSFAEASASFRVAVTAAELAETLRQSTHVQEVDFPAMLAATEVVDFGTESVAELRELIGLAAELW